MAKTTLSQKAKNLTSKKMTHTGTVKGKDGAGKYRRRTVKLREGTAYWITPLGAKYKKADGTRPGNTTRLLLDVSTIKKI